MQKTLYSLTAIYSRDYTDSMTTQNYAVQTSETGNRVIRFIGSDESVDRDGDTVSIDGWDVSAYLSNPVVLFGHDNRSLPVAKTIAVTVDRRTRQLIFDVQFPTVEELSTDPKTPSEHALKVDAIYNMAKKGLLNTVSVGFKGIEYDHTPTGRAYRKQELIELSIVPVPSNKNALAILRDAGTLETIIKELTMETKAGKRLSKESREALKSCHGKIMTAIDELKAFIDMDDEDEVATKPEDKGTGKPAVGQEIGTNVMEQAPEKQYCVEIV